MKYGAAILLFEQEEPPVKYTEMVVNSDDNKVRKGMPLIIEDIHLLSLEPDFLIKAAEVVFKK